MSMDSPDNSAPISVDEVFKELVRTQVQELVQPQLNEIKQIQANIQQQQAELQAKLEEIQRELSHQIEQNQSRVIELVQDLTGVAGVQSRNALARDINRITRYSERLRPLANADGLLPPDFPATKVDMVDLTDDQLGTLLTFYGLPVPASREGRYEALGLFLGM